MNTNSPNSESQHVIDFSKNLRSNFYLDNNEKTINLSLKKSFSKKDFIIFSNGDNILSSSIVDINFVLNNKSIEERDNVHKSFKSNKKNGNENKNETIISSIMISLNEESSYDAQKVNTDYITKKSESKIQNDPSKKVDEKANQEPKKNNEQIKIQSKKSQAVNEVSCSCRIF